MTNEEKKSSETELPLYADSVQNRLVQLGRICCVIYGNHYRKLVTIVDFIDRNRVLVTGCSGVLSNIKRITFPLRWLQCTKFRLNIKERDINPGQLKELATSANVKQAWFESSYGRRNVSIKRRDRLNDFGRFKLYFIKGQFKKKVQSELLKLRAADLSAKNTNKKKKITAGLLRAQNRKRLETHPVLRRVVGRFHRKLKSRITKKQRIRKQRLKRHSVSVGYTSNKGVRKMQNNGKKKNKKQKNQNRN